MTLTANKYRKKPVVIEAMQWDGTEADAHAIIAFDGTDFVAPVAAEPEL